MDLRGHPHEICLKNVWRVGGTGAAQGHLVCPGHCQQQQQAFKRKSHGTLKKIFLILFKSPAFHNQLPLQTCYSSYGVMSHLALYTAIPAGLSPESSLSLSVMFSLFLGRKTCVWSKKNSVSDRNNCSRVLRLATQLHWWFQRSLIITIVLRKNWGLLLFVVLY